MPTDGRDGHDRQEHYGDRRRHRDASVPHVGHSNVMSSGNPPKRGVFRRSGIGCTHFGQHGGLGADLSQESLSMDKNRTMS
jgi:hypothetical protein